MPNHNKNELTIKKIKRKDDNDLYDTECTETASDCTSDSKINCCASINDPNGENYNIDPAGDDVGSEGNKTEGNGQYDEEEDN